MTNEELQRENEELRRQLVEAEDTLRAIREGQVDAIVMDGMDGPRIFSLAGAETIYRLAVETMAEAAINTTVDGLILFCNARFSEFVAMPMEQLLGHEIIDFIPPEDRQAFRALLRECSDQSVKQRITLCGPGGVRRPVHLTGTALRQGENVSLCLVAADLTDLENSTQQIELLRENQHQLEQVHAELRESRLAALNLMEDALEARRETEEAAIALRVSEKKYRNLFENMTEEVHFWRLVRDETGCIQTWQLVDANPPALKSWGWDTVAEIRGKTTDEIFGPGAAEHYMPVVQKIITEGVSHSYEDYFPNLDKYFRFTSVPLGNYFITTGADITAIKKAEQALRSAFTELEQRMAELQTLMDVAPVAIAIGHDPQGKEITANQLLSKWLNAPLGANVSLGTPKEQRPLDYQVFRNGQPVCTEDLPIQYAALNGQKVQNDELTLVRSDGLTIDMLANAEPLFDADGQVRGSIAAYMDITERKRAENELRAARDELEERVRERTAELEQRNIELQILSNAEREQRQLAEALVKAALILNNSLNQDEVLQHILEQICEVIPYQFASIALLDGETFYDASYLGTLDSSEAQYGLKRRFRLKDFPVLKKMCQTGQPILMPDTSQDSDWVAVDNLKWSCSFLAAPLLVEKRVIGFVQLFSAQPLFFTETMCGRLVAFAAHAAVAIQNAWLFERVRAGSERLQSLSRRLVEIQESERLYIARELHDEAGQMLTSLIVHLRVLEKDASHPELVLKKVAEMEASLNDVFDSLHRIAMALRPATLDHLGLVAALHQYVESVGEKHNLKVSFISEKLRERLSSNVETVLYRIVQEALTNVVRHAHATQVDVVLTVRDNKLILIIEDDGAGFDPNAVSDGGHLGLFGMRERIETVEGKLIIESSPGKGTTVMAEVEI